jgi:hypothetical protein
MNTCNESRTILSAPRVCENPAYNTVTRTGMVPTRRKVSEHSTMESPFKAADERTLLRCLRHVPHGHIINRRTVLNHPTNLRPPKYLASFKSPFRAEILQAPVLFAVFTPQRRLEPWPTLPKLMPCHRSLSPSLENSSMLRDRAKWIYLSKQYREEFR